MPTAGSRLLEFAQESGQDRDPRYAAARVVGDVGGVEAETPAGLVCVAGGDEAGTLRGTEIFDGARHRYARVLAGIAGNGQGEVGQSEDGAAHDVAERIAVVVLDVQLAHGVIARSFHDATARVLGEPVVTEEVVQLFQRGVIAQPLCHMFTSY